LAVNAVTVIPPPMQQLPPEIEIEQFLRSEKFAYEK
jgi:hypothetical protein